MVRGIELGGERKARGAFFTPAPIARFVSSWAVRSADDSILEPSCGEAAFLLAAANKLSLLGCRFGSESQLSGVELHADSARLASSLLVDSGAKATIKVGDFFGERPEIQYDAVVGNPPFIRYQEFSGEVRARSLEAALSQGVRLSGLASSWAAFTVHASRFVKPSGRLGLVLPAELLTVGYAAEVRRFLLRRFGRVRLILFDQRVFPEVLEDTILLLAEGGGGASHLEVYQAKNADDLASLAITGWTDHQPDRSDRWTPALLDSDSYGAFIDSTATANIGELSDWGSAYLGAVTGNNSFFCLTPEEVRDYGLKNEVRSISPPGARHLRGVTFTRAAFESLSTEGKRTFLFYPSAEPSEAAWRYIKSGESKRVQDAYKCKVRSPWWRVPLIRQPDFIVTYMNNDRLRFVRNEAGVDIINSVYGFRLREFIDRNAAEYLPISLFNSVTLLSAELSGRVHGGGLLKHEPRELERLVTPTPECLANASITLAALRPQIGRLLRKNEVGSVVDLVDQCLLLAAAGLNPSVIATIRKARERLLARRLSLSGAMK